MRIFVILALACALVNACSYDFCNGGSSLPEMWKPDGWYCCYGDSVLCDRGELTYSEHCPRGCDRGTCVPGPWCSLKSSTSQSTYCDISYNVDRETDFKVLDSEAEILVRIWTANAGNCTAELYHQVACYQVYVPCDDHAMNLCRNYSTEASNCDDRIKANQCVWSDANQSYHGTDAVFSILHFCSFYHLNGSNSAILEFIRNIMHKYMHDIICVK